jgi:hypothetical protein
LRKGSRRKGSRRKGSRRKGNMRKGNRRRKRERNAPKEGGGGVTVLNHAPTPHPPTPDAAQWVAI